MDKIEANKKIYAIFGNINEVDYGVTFIGSPEEGLQFAVLRCRKGKFFQPHIHKHRPRTIKQTQESFFILKGKVKAFIFDENKKLIHEQVMMPGQFVISYRGGHGFEILKGRTIIIENKLGDFIGIEQDKEKF